MTQLNPNWIQASTYSARLDRQVIKASWSEGVLSGMKVSQRASGGPAMFVDIAVGVAVIYGDDQTDQGAYLATITALETVGIAAAPGSNSRKDLVYLRINDPNAGGPAGSNSAIGVVTGTAAPSPVVPALPTSALPLAVVTVSVGQVQVVDANILSTRIPAYGKDANPPGTPMVFFGTEAMVPADCILYAGQSVSKDTYWRAYYFIGDTFGSTSTNFTLPDLRGRAPFGLDNMTGSDAGRLAVANTLGASGGAELHTLITAEMPSHQHLYSSIYTQGATGGITPAAIAGDFLTQASYGGGGALINSVQPTGGGTAHNNMPPYLLCNWIAKF